MFSNFAGMNQNDIEEVLQLHNQYRAYVEKYTWYPAADMQKMVSIGCLALPVVETTCLQEICNNSMPKSFEILMVCLQKGAAQCCDATNPNHTHCSC